MGLALMIARARLVAAVVGWVLRLPRWARTLVIGAAVLALLVVAYRHAPESLQARLDPTAWSWPQWVSTVFLGLMLVSVWGIGGALVATNARQDDVWEDVDRLRGEVAELREQVAQRGATRVATAMFPSSPVDPPTDEIPTVKPDDPPTTVTGIPSARPPVPGAAEAPVERRGRHAAAD